MAVAEGEERRSMRFSVAAAFLIAAVALLSDMVASLDRRFNDALAGWRQHNVSTDVVIVEIDARSLHALGTWPLPRSTHAKLIERLNEAQPRSIFLDIDFSAESIPAQDAALAAAIAASESPVFLPAFWQPSSDRAGDLMLSEPLPSLRARGELALVNLVPGPDGLVREIPDLRELSSRRIPPVWAMLLDAENGRAGPLIIDYRISPRSFPRISYIDVLNGAASEQLRARRVMVGATAIELADITPTPVHRALPGVVVQALAFESARRPAVQRIPIAAVLVCLLIWCIALAALISNTTWRAALPATGALTLCGCALISALYLKANVIAPITPFVNAAVVLVITGLLGSLRTESFRALRALLHSRDQDRLLRNIIENSTDAVLTLDRRSVVRSANPAAAALLSTAPHRLIDAPLPAQPAELHERIMQTLRDPQRLSRDACVRHASGHMTLVHITASDLQWRGETIAAVTLRDVTAQRSREEELHRLARQDSLTGLPNRLFLTERLTSMLGACKRVALFMLDLDGFKEVNDTLGHSMGDQLMVALGERMSQLQKVGRWIARMGGDEFAIVWAIRDDEEALELARQLPVLIEEPITIQGVPIALGASVGVAIFPQHAADPESLLKRADVALYVAKRRRTQVEVYEPKTDTNTPRRLEMLTQLRSAVAREELELHYQPKVTIAAGRVDEVEALCRWNSPTLGLVSPSEFIPLAEASDIIRPLTEWTIFRALSDVRRWQERGLNLKVAVNLSARHLQDARLPRWIAATLEQTGAGPEQLELEITESAIMADPERAARILACLRDLGVTLSIDDFGTGYSSLAYLRGLSVDRLKIDRSFISGAAGGRRDRIILRSTIQLAHGLGLLAVAEGVETAQQYELLRDDGCDIAQGFLIARPMTEQELFQWRALRADESGVLSWTPSVDCDRDALSRATGVRS